MCRASPGGDWMLNSDVLESEYSKPGTRTLVIAGAIFVTYPIWLWLGMRHTR